MIFIQKFILFLFLLVPVTSNAITSELQAREEIINSVKALFISEQFELLNRKGAPYIKNQERTSSGIWKLSVFYKGLTSIANSKVMAPQYWADLKEKVKRWSELDEDVSFSHMVYVDILIDEAWMHRGSGSASSVRKDDWKPFKDKIEEARQYLLGYDQFKSVDPYWYENMLIIAKAQSWNINNFSVFSCLAKDKQMTQKLMGMLKDRPMMSVWKTSRLYEYCKNFR